MIRYYKLFDLLNRRGMKKSDLRTIISSRTVAKLSKGEIITTEVIDKICLFLGCQPSDIMEVVSEETDGTTTKIKKDYLTNEDPDIEATETEIYKNGKYIETELDDPLHPDSNKFINPNKKWTHTMW